MESNYNSFVDTMISCDFEFDYDNESNIWIKQWENNVIIIKKGVLGYDLLIDDIEYGSFRGETSVDINLETSRAIRRYEQARQ